MQKTGQKAVKKFHHLITGKIIFELKRENQKEDGLGDIHAVELNAVITTRDGVVSAQTLGRAQQNLQIHHMKRAGDQAQFIAVQDVIILGISHLGHMTDAEFNDIDIPAAMAQNEQVTAAVSTDNVTQLRGKNDKADPFVK